MAAAAPFASPRRGLLAWLAGRHPDALPPADHPEDLFRLLYCAEALCSGRDTSVLYSTRQIIIIARLALVMGMRAQREELLLDSWSGDWDDSHDREDTVACGSCRGASGSCGTGPCQPASPEGGSLGVPSAPSPAARGRPLSLAGLPAAFVAASKPPSGLAGWHGPVPQDPLAPRQLPQPQTNEAGAGGPLLPDVSVSLVVDSAAPGTAASQALAALGFRLLVPTPRYRPVYLESTFARIGYLSLQGHNRAARQPSPSRLCLPSLRRLSTCLACDIPLEAPALSELLIYAGTLRGEPGRTLLGLIASPPPSLSKLQFITNQHENLPDGLPIYASLQAFSPSLESVRIVGASTVPAEAATTTTPASALTFPRLHTLCLETAPPWAVELFDRSVLPPLRSLNASFFRASPPPAFASLVSRHAPSLRLLVVRSPEGTDMGQGSGCGGQAAREWLCEVLRRAGQLRSLHLSKFSEPQRSYAAILDALADKPHATLLAYPEFVPDFLRARLDADPRYARCPSMLACSPALAAARLEEDSDARAMAVVERQLFARARLPLHFASIRFRVRGFVGETIRELLENL
jgi:hypothetical protein